MEKIMVSVKGLEKAAVLAALYNRATTGGMGFMQYTPTPMTVEQAEKILRLFERVTRKILFWEIEKRPAKRIDFDYLAGRAMKVDLSSDEEFDAQTYDRYTGSGSAAAAIERLRQTGDVNPPITQFVHYASTLAAIEETRVRLSEKPRPTQEAGPGCLTTIHMTLSDVAGVLGPKIDEVERRLHAEISSLKVEDLISGHSALQ